MTPDPDWHGVACPHLGSEALTVGYWYVETGDRVVEGERLLELLMPGASYVLSAPITGRLVRRLANSRLLVHPGETLGYLAPD